jgi:DNA-binding NtrC family response regulator
MTVPSGSGPPVILVVDDDEDVRETTSLILGTRGFEVLVAAGTTEAMAICDARRGRVDALIADLSLPGEGTGDLTRLVSAAYPAIRVIYATGIPRHVAMNLGLVQPGIPYLEKPLSGDSLVNVLQSVLPRRTA